MGAEIDRDAVLDCVEFQISDSDRYDAHIISGDRKERVGCGPMGQLIEHLPQIKVHCLNGSPANIKLELPNNLRESTWFTKTTVTRFLIIINSKDMLQNVFAIYNELSQLEETRRFHLSLYSEGHDDTSMNDDEDSSNLAGATSIKKAENRIQSSDDSKNELLRAVDLRLTALRGELMSAFNVAAQSTCSIKEIASIKNLSEHFGIESLSKLLLKLLEMSQSGQAVDHQSDTNSITHNLRTECIKQTEEVSQAPSSYEKPVTYGASPAKVAQVERKSSTDSDKSYSSDEERPRVERSRTLTRSATPRRPASPMRRVQIGRSSSRRTPALAIKSLNYIPTRERTFPCRDAATNDSEVEESGKTHKNLESSVKRMSVQDAINLFESKQRDQTSVSQARTTQIDNAENKKKSVLRRWSAGMGESSARCLTEDASECTTSLIASDLVKEEITNKAVEMKEETSPASVDSQPTEITKHIEKLEVTDAGSIDPQEADFHVCPVEETQARLDHNEWNQQKEAELNQLLMKFAESKPVQYRATEPDCSMNCDSGSQQSSGFGDHSKDRQDEKHSRSAAMKTEKPANIKAVRKGADKLKAEMPSGKAIDVGKKESGNKTNKIVKTVQQAASFKKESPKPASGEKKASPKTQPMPAVRKSWPSTPSSLKTTGPSPAKAPTGISSSGSAASRPKSLSTTLSSRPGPRVERSQVLQKDGNTIKADVKRSSKSVAEKKQQTILTGKTLKTKSTTAAADKTAVAPQKPASRNKMTKKSTVVPLKSKPSTERASEISPSNSPIASLKDISSVGNGPDKEYQVPASTQEVEEVSTVCDPVSKQVLEDPVAHEIDAISTVFNEPEKLIEEAVNSSDQEITDKLGGEVDETLQRIETSLVEDEIEEVEHMISPTSWIEDSPLVPPIPNFNNTAQSALPAKLAVMEQSGPRAHCSLSQMLLEEISETDVTDWGVAENPATVVFQKDAPKGLKRLLKFARKSKGEAALTGASSPCYSDGEDDECKSLSSKNSDKLQGNVSLHREKYKKQVRPNTSKNAGQSSSKFHEVCVSSTTTTRATRSFFSLSAFRGNKGSDSRLH